MTRKAPISTIPYYRQRPDELDSACRTVNTIQIVCLLIATIGSGLYLGAKFLPVVVNSGPLAEWLVLLASHPAMDVLLIVVIGAFYFSARAYSDAGRFLLVRSILADERVAAPV